MPFCVLVIDLELLVGFFSVVLGEGVVQVKGVSFSGSPKRSLNATP